MEKSSVSKCRTCLKKSTQMFPLSKLIMESQTNLTYGQLLQECTNIEYFATYELFMPQNLCFSCCQELNKVYNFIRQAQYCNNKLISLLAKRLQKSDVKIEKAQLFNEKRNEDNLHITNNNKFKIVNTSVLLKPVVLDKIPEIHTPIQINENENEETEFCESTSNTNTQSPAATQTICPICEKTINGENSLITHMQIQHDIIAAKRDILKKRRKNKTPKERVFECSLCDYKARTYGAIDFHNLSKHGTEDDKVKCNFCPYTSWKKFSLFKHIKKSHREQIKSLKKNAENHLQQSGSHQNENKISDDNENSSNADGTSVTQTAINTTIEDNFDTTIEQEREDLSDEQFIRNILNIKKRQYQTKSTNNLPRRCDECGNIYNNLPALKTHKKNVHISDEQYSVCPDCGKKFKTRKNLNVHMRNSHNPDSIKIRKKPTSQNKEKCFMCSHCSYACVSKPMLTHHVNRHHTGEKPYKCDVCNKSFVVPFDLKIHRYLHTGERPYKCSICPKRFRCSSHLIKHKRIHNNERPYKCKDCDKTFTQSSNLKLHKNVHLKAKNFKCMVCSKYFDNESLLNAHRISENHYEEIE